jgi:hypothetical protein
MSGYHIFMFDPAALLILTVKRFKLIGAFHDIPKFLQARGIKYRA